MDQVESAPIRLGLDPRWPPIGSNLEDWAGRPARKARSEGDQPQPEGLHDRLAPALRAELAEDGVDVELGGVLADPQGLGDAPVRESLGQLLEDLVLARRERFGQLSALHRRQLPKLFL